MIDELLEPDKEKDVKPFEDWLEDAEDRVLDIFEEDIYEVCNELTEIAVDQIITAYQYTFYGSPTWDAYWKMFNEWLKNWISEDGMKELEKAYDRWNEQQ